MIAIATLACSVVAAGAALIAAIPVWWQVQERRKREHDLRVMADAFRSVGGSAKWLRDQMSRRGDEGGAEEATPQA